MLADDANEPVPQGIVRRYLEEYARPGGMTGALNYYRAALWGGAWAGVGRVDAPTLVLWGERDPYLDGAMAAPPPALAPRCTRVVRYPGATHWLAWDERAAVAQELGQFFLQPAEENGT
jgi:pimeloyl-ACP methyl ester carboxylesterase